MSISADISNLKDGLTFINFDHPANPSRAQENRDGFPGNANTLLQIRFGRLIFITFIVLILTASVSPAQTLDSLQSGTRIRLLGRTGGEIIGGFDSNSTDAIRLYAPGQERIVSIPWSVISSVQMSTGSHTHAGRGASIGFLSGTLLAAMLALTSSGGGDIGPNAIFGFLELRLALPGLLLGALIGSQVRTDVWIDVSDARTHGTGMNMRLNREIRIGFRF